MSRYLDARGRWSLSLVEAAALVAAPAPGVGLPALRAAIVESVCRGVLTASITTKGLLGRKQSISLMPGSAAASAPALLTAFVDPTRLDPSGVELGRIVESVGPQADDIVATSVYRHLESRGLWAPRSVGRISETAQIKGVRETPEGEVAASHLREAIAILIEEVSICAEAARAASKRSASKRSGKGPTGISDACRESASRGDVRALVSELGVAALLVPRSIVLLDEVIKESLLQGLAAHPVAAHPVPVGGGADLSAPAETTGVPALLDLRGVPGDESPSRLARAVSAIDDWFDGQGI